MILVQLEEEVAEKTQTLERTQRVVEETQQVVEERTQALERTQRVVEETCQQMEETRQEMEETRQEVDEKTKSLEETQQEMEKRTQELVASRDKNLSLRESLRQQQQQHLEVLQQKDRKIQQAIQRVSELEQKPEGYHQRRYTELEEENRRLSAQAQRSLCKVCLDKEVQVVFLPCTHMVTCEGCVSTFHFGKCPMCKQNIQNKIKVSLA